MSKALSASVTFEALVTRVTTLEGGPTFTGTVHAPALVVTGNISDGDTQFGLSYNVSSPSVSFDSNDSITFDRTANTYNFVIGGTVQASVGSTFITIAGDANMGLAKVGSDLAIRFDTNDYLYYSRSSNKLFLVIGGTNVASIDASGNMKLLGTLTQSTTP
jgi:hypothetical protein